MKKLLTIFLLLTYGICSGQNLVPNGDFEQYYHCPNATTEIDSTYFWMRPTIGTPDYLNSCCNCNVNVPNSSFGFQHARSGGAFVGIVTYSESLNNYREYIEVPLTSPLIQNTCYHLEMYFNLGNPSIYTSSDIGIYFSDTIITGVPNVLPLPYTPQIINTTGNSPDTLNWTLVSGNYTAIGGENYITIGNFKNDTTTIATIYNPTGGSHIIYVYIEDVSLTTCDVGIAEQNENRISIYPNPITDKLNVQINHNEPTEIILYDLSSRKLLQQTFTNATTINTEQIAKGMYLYTVRNRNGIIKNGKVIKQ